MSLEQDWNKKLEEMGMPEEPISEQEKAAKADVELISTEMMDPEAEIIAKKLKEEDPRNIFGGFPNSIGMLVSLIKNLQNEAGDKKIGIHIHNSCINNNDCITIIHPDGKIYHYNTKNIPDYSTEKMKDRFENQNIPFKEKFS